MNNEQDRPVTLRERQREQTREHLLTVATDLFGAKGFKATSIDDIARTAGAGRATVYAYFATKDAILSEIIERLWDDAEKLYLEFGELAEWNRLEVRRWLLEVLRRWESDRPGPHAAMEANPALRAGMFARYINRFADALMHNSALWEARFSNAEGRRRAMMLISMLESYMTKLFRDDIEQDRSEAMETVTDVWLDVLHARA